MPTRLQLIYGLALTFVILVFGRPCYTEYVSPEPTPIVPATDRVIAYAYREDRNYTFTELAAGGVKVEVNGKEVPSQVLESGQVELTFPDGLVERFGYDAEGKISLIDFTPSPPPPPKPKPKPKPKPDPAPPSAQEEYDKRVTQVNDLVYKLKNDIEIRRGWKKRCGDWEFFISSRHPDALCFVASGASSFSSTLCYYSGSARGSDVNRADLRDIEQALAQCNLGGAR